MSDPVEMVALLALRKYGELLHAKGGVAHMQAFLDIVEQRKGQESASFIARCHEVWKGIGEWSKPIPTATQH